MAAVDAPQPPRVQAENPIAIKKFYIINTGGTFSSVSNPASKKLGPPLKHEDQVKVHDAVTAIVAETKQADSEWFHTWLRDRNGAVSLIDSSSLVPHVHWTAIVDNIDGLLQGVQAGDVTDVSGVVVIHGTDTLAYTAAALTFVAVKKRWPFPIVVTGSQLPLLGHAARTDAARNLADAMLALESSALGQSGVSVVFNGKAMAGTRVVKGHSTAFEAFTCPKDTEAGGDVKVVLDAGGVILPDVPRQGRRHEPLDYAPVNPHVNIRMVRIVPDIDLRIYLSPKDSLQKLVDVPMPDAKTLAVTSFTTNGLVIEALGAGNGPLCSKDPPCNSPDCRACRRFHGPLARIAEVVPVYCVTDCAGGKVSKDYDNSLSDVPGVHGMSNCTSEAAFVKLLFAVSAVVLTRGRKTNATLLAHVNKEMDHVLTAGERSRD
jgi:L-asparaginase/Glu-tRNA(Gln) amidotransferase subunit D